MSAEYQDDMKNAAASNECWAAEQKYETAKAMHQEMLRPSTLYRPALSIDGNKWCALYGANLQDGVAGFGDSPALAYADFDRQWVKRIEKR